MPCAVAHDRGIAQLPAEAAPSHRRCVGVQVLTPAPMDAMQANRAERGSPMRVPSVAKGGSRRWDLTTMPPCCSRRWPRPAEPVRAVLEDARSQGDARDGAAVAEPATTRALALHPRSETRGSLASVLPGRTCSRPSTSLSAERGRRGGRRGTNYALRASGASVSAVRVKSAPGARACARALCPRQETRSATGQRSSSARA